MSFKESIIAKLWWFFKLEKRRYIVGILALSLVSVLNLIPPMVMGRVIDAITSGKLTNQILLLNLVYYLTKTTSCASGSEKLLAMYQKKSP